MGLRRVPIPLDEYPVHQTPLPMDRVASSDRNFYDRCYFNAHDRSGDVFLVTGLGVYPNLGVIDAYATARCGDRQWSVPVDGPGVEQLERVRPDRSGRGRPGLVFGQRVSALSAAPP